MFNKKHALALAAASAMALGATSLSAAPVLTNTASVKAASADGMTQVRYKHHRTHVRGGQSQNWGPFGVPFAAAAGAGAIAGGALATTGAIVGGTTAAVTGYPYGPYANSGYGAYAYAPDAYGSYAYAPGGLARDIGHGYYNGVAAPASQDSCAVDGGYGRLDYAVGC
jgi:hypothetical protein